VTERPDILAVAEARNARRNPPKYPEGVEPGVRWDELTRTGTAGIVTDGEPDWSIVLTRANLDPGTIEVVPGTVQIRSWDAAIGDGQVRTMLYYRAQVRAIRDHAPDMDELLRLVRRRPRLSEPRPDGSESYLALFADWQLGKRGTASTVERIARAIDAAADRLKVVRKRPGRRIGSVTLPFLGDLGEACDGHYAMQAFEVELDYREQRRLGRRLALYAVDTFAPLAERIVVPTVPGNHGEARKDGKAFTTFGDNQDIEIVEGVAEACAMNPGRYGHVAFVIPQNDLTLTLEVGGLITAFAHGHQAKRGGTTPQSKMANWWSGQAFGQRPAGDARMLYSGHYHHLSIVEHGPRIHVQAPTMDSGSQWWDETAGLPSRGGLLTLVQGPDGIHDWEVL